MASGTSPSAAEETLRTTVEKANFQRLTWLLMRGGLALLRDVFDTIHRPANLPAVLSAKKVHLQTLKTTTGNKVLTYAEWKCLYNPHGPGTYGKSADFDISLLYKLLRSICSLTAPVTGWDKLPNSTDHSREADIVRIRCLRNTLHGHNERMEVTDADFEKLWKEISEAFLRIAGGISSAKKDEWKKAIEKFFHEPLTPEAKKCVEELQSWYLKEMETNARVQELTEEMKQMRKMLMDIYILVKEPIARESTPQGPSAIPEQQQIEFEGSAGVSTSSGLLSQQDHPIALDFWTIVKSSFDLLFKYLKMKLGVDVQGYRLGSLVLTVSCSSMEVLETLWGEYRTGHLNEMIQDTLVTAEVLEKLNLVEVKLTTFITEEDYLSCKDFLKKSSGNSFFFSVQIIL